MEFQENDEAQYSQMYTSVIYCYIILVYNIA